MKQENTVVEKMSHVMKVAMNKWKEQDDIFKIIGIVRVGVVIFWLMWKCMCCVGKQYECRCERKKKVKATEEEDVIFQSAGGSVYHTRSDCRGLGKAKAEPKRMCLFCQQAKVKLD